ncbi:hypothetical protein [Gemmobacter nectariphilus]|uniref:hypothetical protein n=1 Tax=Gemmobacter nectariphilus TaxID=220343 RepID=UPI00041C5679|nr:hypothetical protein [Gemmobacter nectariphilus]
MNAFPFDRSATMKAAAAERLALFAEWTGTTPPERILDGEGAEATFSDALLAYAEAEGLSLDWLWLADDKGLVMACHNAAKAEAARKALPPAGNAKFAALDGVLDAIDELAKVQDMLELLFMAGEGIARSDHATGSAIVRGAGMAQHALTAARDLLDAARAAMVSGGEA